MSDSDTFAVVTQSQTYYRVLPVSKNKACIIFILLYITCVKDQTGDSNVQPIPNNS
jgi:hypothetical protein